MAQRGQTLEPLVVRLSGPAGKAKKLAKRIRDEAVSRTDANKLGKSSARDVSGWLPKDEIDEC
jgi:hypothetical protein